jgi:hypothetical protein
MGYKEYQGRLTESVQVNADANSTNYLDFETTNPSLDDGRIFGIWITVEAVATAGTGIAVEIVQKASEPGTGDATICKHTFLAAELTAGKEVFCPISPNITPLRYLRAYYDITAGTEDYTLSAYYGPY